MQVLRKAILTITEQGEGTTKGEGMPADQVDCHYGLFVNIDKDLDKIIEEAETKRDIICSVAPMYR